MSKNIIDSKTNSNSNEEMNIELELGNVIRIKSPKNEKLNMQTFIIDYIDNQKMLLTNVDTFNSTKLKINPDGTIGDGSITELAILSRSDKKGYARQNNLLPGTWINIYFGGDIPVILTGEITNLEEDMIEIKTVDNDVIYINFDYKGIPEDLPIENIEIREKPSQPEPKEEPIIEIEEEIPELEREKQVVKAEELQITVPVEKVKAQIREFIIKADQIKFGDEELGPIAQFIDVSDKRRRYSIEQQVSDLLDDLLSTVPSSQRTERVLNNIHIIIERFKQLREYFSFKDEYGNVEGALVRESSYKPLLSYFNTFSNNLYWIMPVVKNKKKVYSSDTSDETTQSVVDIELDKDLTKITELINLYKGDELNNEENKYSSLYTSLNPYFTPFEYINDETISEILVEKSVNDNINVIIDNLGDMYSSIYSNKKLRSRRFVIDKYNLGLSKLDATSFSGNKMIATRVKLTKPDTMSIKSFLLLPEPVMRFSKVNLPGTFMLERSNLNQSFINYWELLKTDTFVKNVIIDNLNENVEYSDDSFATSIKNIVLNLSEDEKRGMSNEQLYMQFMSHAIPKIKTLFQLMKKYIKGKLSIVDVVGYLEPFLIYTDSLTYMQYKEIVKFIDDQISEFNRTFIEKTKSFTSLSNYFVKENRNYPKVFENVQSVISNIKNKNNMQDEVFSTYDIDFGKDTPFSNLEILRKIILKDYGHLYTYALSLQNSVLVYPLDLSNLLESEGNQLQRDINADKSSDECKTIVVAKRYQSVEDLNKDNDIEIYFDKSLDRTNYRLLNDYENEMAKRTPDDFLVYLVKDLKEKNKLDDDQAERLAETLVIGHKKVIDGNYAIVYKFTGNKEDEFVYYIRKDGKWILDETVGKNVKTTDDDILCNFQEKCINATSPKQKEDKCEGVSLNELQLQKDAIKDVIDAFDAKYHKSKEEYESFVQERYKYYMDILPIISKIQNENMLKYNKQKYKLASEVDDEALISSPFQPLLNVILAQEDYTKKQHDINRFVNSFTRAAYENAYGPLGKLESSSWLYCIKTGVKLLPTFRHDMAVAWIKDQETFNDFVDNLINRVGKKSDDGDWWIDEKSGWPIRRIDFDVEEGYEDGFRVSSRDVLTKQLGDSILTQSKQVIVQTPESRIISNITNAVSFAMGINLETQKDFIINCVSQKIRNDLPAESDYKKFMKDMANKNKVVPSFTELYNSTILYNTLGMILIAIQTSIPSIKTRKTFPGCIRSFSGYPFEGNGDFTSLQYLTCIAYDIKRTTVEPWDAMKKKTQTYIFDKIKNSIDGTEKVAGLISFPEVKRKIEEKTEYLLSMPLDDVPEEHRISNWTQFLPPLVSFKIKNLENISGDFKTALVTELKTGSRKQQQKIGVINSKIIQFSLAIQSAIQGILNKKAVLLKNSNNEPYLENACCNERSNETTIQYFENKDASIKQYNEIVNNLTHILQDIETYTKSVTFSSNINTKNKYPPISNDFSESTIYLAFIHYCKFKSLLSIPEKLLPFCSDKPNALIDPNDSLAEIVKKLKADGRNYTLDTFLRMLQIIGRNNIVNLSFDTPIVSSIATLILTLDAFDLENEEIVEPALRKLIMNALDTFDMATQQTTNETRALNDYLLKNIESMKDEILRFVTDNKGNNLSITKKSLKKMTSFVNTINMWHKEMDVNDDNISNDAAYNQINYYKNMMNNIINVFPNIILNKVDYSRVNIPNYWGYSNIHETKLKMNVKQHYERLKPFYSESSITKILNTVSETAKNIMRLSNVIPCFSTIKHKDKVLRPIFDERTSNLLFEFLLLRTFIHYIDLADDKNMIVRETKKQMTVDDVFTVEYVEEKDTKSDVQETTYSEIDVTLLRGNQKELRQKIAHLILVYFDFMETAKDVVNVSYSQIKDRIFKMKTAEKDKITDRLKRLTDEERDIDTMLKINKLGVWSKGLQKGLTTYVKETYDEEREFMDHMETVERKIKSKMKGISEENMDLYLDDALQEEAAAQDIENDVNDIGFLTEDYMDGNYDTMDAPELDNYDDYN